MARTTQSAVLGIIGQSVRVASLTPFIDTANMMVTRVCGTAGYTDSELEIIERWLAAHYYAIRDPRLVSDVASGVGATYQANVGMCLKLTPYGQQVLALDVEGGFAKLELEAETGKKKPAPGLFYLGSDKPCL